MVHDEFSPPPQPPSTALDLQPGKLLAAAALLSCLTDLNCRNVAGRTRREERHRCGLGRGDDRVSSNAYALAGAARLVSLKIVLLDPLYVSAAPPSFPFAQ